MSVRDSLTSALSLDLVGPGNDGIHAEEVLPLPPSRWYLTGFLAPWNAPSSQKRDEDDTQGELEYGEAGGPGDDDEATPEPRAARRSHFPSSMGLSVLVPAGATELRVGVQWGDYTPDLKDNVATGEWQRRQRQETVVVPLIPGPGGGTVPPQPVPGSHGLDIVTSIRVVREREDLRGIPAGTPAVSVFLVNKREALEGQDDVLFRREPFVLQTGPDVTCDQPSCRSRPIRPARRCWALHHKGSTLHFVRGLAWQTKQMPQRRR
jgi:hypothetical protein